MTKRSAGSRLLFWGAAGVVVLALVAGTVGLLLPRADAPQGQPAPTAAAAPGTDSGDGAGCERTSSSREVPGDLRWTASKGVTWPVSDTVGPTRVVEGFPVCFEHSPIGAALAATSMLYAMVDHSAESTSAFWATDSPGKAKYVETGRELDATGKNPIVDGLAAQGGTVAGFRIDDYTGDTALVRVVFKVPGSQRGYTGIAAQMVWTDGDWRYRANDLGGGALPVDLFADEFTGWGRDG